MNGASIAALFSQKRQVHTRHRRLHSLPPRTLHDNHCISTTPTTASESSSVFATFRYMKFRFLACDRKVVALRQLLPPVIPSARLCMQVHNTWSTSARENVADLPHGEPSSWPIVALSCISFTIHVPACPLVHTFGGQEPVNCCRTPRVCLGINPTTISQHHIVLSRRLVHLRQWSRL